MKKLFFFTVIFFLFSRSYAEMKILPKYNYFYENEKIELVIDNPDLLTTEINFSTKSTQLTSIEVSSQKKIFSLSENIFKLGNNLIDYKYQLNDSVFSNSLNIKILKKKKNSVRIDHSSSAVIVDNLPFFPVGFYCYTPVRKALLDEEVTKGFNLISPYFHLENQSIETRKKLLDRCAKLGLKVNYNLCSLIKSGGINSNTKEKDLFDLDKVIKEIETFKDHPALLSWYISDEPDLNNIEPKFLENIYNKIREIDPYHPITMVFMRVSNSKDYKDSFDIIMSDPYPVPNDNLNMVYFRSKYLNENFSPEKPVWIVPQAFGGNEWWLREPTRQEIRIMTYMAVINNVTGFQYFIRKGYNSFPKSSVTWSECSKISLELAELTPFLLSNQIQPNISTKYNNIIANIWKKNDEYAILVINTKNKPQKFDLNLSSNLEINQLEILGENRKIEVEEDNFSDYIDGFGAKIYLKKNNYKSLSKEKNLIIDPSFEDLTIPGTPTYCYVYAGTDRGSSYFVDSRTAFDGDHSIRITNPTFEKGPKLSFYRVKLKPDITYKVSVMAKGTKSQIIKKKSFWQKIQFWKDFSKPYKFLLQANNTKKFYKLTNKWEKYEFEVSFTEDDYNLNRSRIAIELIGEGTAWFDLIQIYEKEPQK